MLYHNGDYHYDSYGSFPVGNARLGEFVYITKVSRFGIFPYHISIGNTLGSGDLGWVSKTQLRSMERPSVTFPGRVKQWLDDITSILIDIAWKVGA